MFDEYGYEDEVWADIFGYPDYIISNFGRVWSIRRERFLKPYIDHDGYERVDLYRDKKSKHIKIHRLVSEAFIPKRFEANQINHDDGDKRYNYVENLEWVTGSENRLHAFRIGLQMPSHRRTLRIVETGEVFPSITDCAKTMNGCISSISLCLSGKQRTHKGYTFEYVD